MKKEKSNQKPTRLGSIDRLPARFHNAQEAVMTEDSSAEFMDVMDGNFPLLQVEEDARPPANGVSSLNLQEEASNLWAKLAPKANYVGAKLHFTPPAKHEGKVIAKLDLTEIEYESEYWKTAMLCVVMGANPPIKVFEGFARRVWGDLGIEKIARMNNGVTLVKFNDEATRDYVLEAGVVHFDNKPVIMRPWTPEVNSMKLIKFVSVWVKLPGLGLQYWGTNCLSALVSTIGTPIMVDNITKERSQVKFARVLVEIEIKDEVPAAIEFENEWGVLDTVPVEYEWLPTKCSKCGGLCHRADVCRSNKGHSRMSKTEAKSTIQVEEKDNKSLEGLRDQEALPVHEKSPIILVEKDVINEVGNCLHQQFDQGGEKDVLNRSAKLIKQPKESQLGDCIVENWELPKRKSNHATFYAGTLGDSTGKRKQEKVREILNSNKVGIGAILETKVKGNKIKDIMDTSLYGWDHYTSPIIEGRILIVWLNKFVNVEILAESAQFVHCQIRMTGLDESFCLSFVYGSNSITERALLWQRLANLYMPVKPWTLCGDFNLIFSYSDRTGGKSVSAGELKDANQWLALGLADEMKRSGSQFTWTNNQEKGERIYSKIDWMDFELAQEEYNKAHLALQHDPHSLILQMELNQAREKKLKCSNLYGSLLKQKSKVDWIKFGDENSAYFHACIKNRRDTNRIASFVNEQGQVVEDYSKVVHHFLSHFKSFVGSSSSATETILPQCIEEGKQLSLDQQVKLIRPFSIQDIKNVLFSIPDIKSPSPDGFGSRFFKSMWKDLGQDFSTAILSFFQEGALPKQLNETLLMLIPKVENPSKDIDYRLIACCNTIYKCISKLICNKISEVLPWLVSDNQGAFIKDRSLAHNVLILQDLIKGYH
ncbi:uncharacterized protein LOC115720071 [Cannabis sativa]|uniref:uncharacterized protein LOC115720071 n=1 Tax=Cannabis sativa TaxID=3483 RepID=UPI0029CA1CFC|nr:uncharacterized protein LOC115720071 [Cannabis sativa]